MMQFLIDPSFIPPVSTLPIAFSTQVIKRTVTLSEQRLMNKPSSHFIMPKKVKYGNAKLKTKRCHGSRYHP
jgi:hypothetical protein